MAFYLRVFSQLLLETSLQGHQNQTNNTNPLCTYDTQGNCLQTTIKVMVAGVDYFGMVGITVTAIFVTFVLLSVCGCCTKRRRLRPIQAAAVNEPSENRRGTGQVAPIAVIPQIQIIVVSREDENHAEGPKEQGIPPPTDPDVNAHQIQN